MRPPVRPPAGRPPLVLAAYAAALVLLQYHFPRFPSPNERTRLYLLEAVLHGGTLAIDAPIARHGDMEDRFDVGGHAYSNKAPGLALLALPGYLAADRIAAAAGRDLPLGWALYASRLSAVTLPALALAAALAARVRRRGLAGPHAGALLAGTLFGTGLLPYGALLMAHVTGGALLAAAALLLSPPDAPGPVAAPPRAPEPAGRPALAALAAALAVACDYTLAFSASVLVGWAFLAAPSARRAGRIALGLALPMAVVFAYNAAAFGSPFDLGYTHYAGGDFARIHSQGVLGFGLPSLSGVAGLLLGNSKGLLAWSPLLVLAAPGARALWRTRRGEAAALVLAPAALLLFLSGYPNWHGGWTTGPRYLVPIVPLLALLAVEAVRDSPLARRLLPGLALAGIVLHALPVLTWPFLPELVAAPIADLSWPLARSGELAPSLTGLLGLPDAIGLLGATAAIVTAAAVALAPAPRSGSALAAAALALAIVRGAGTGAVTFCQAEVLYRRGSDARAVPLFERVLRDERPSPAMAEHARRRLAELRPGRWPT